MNRVCTMGLCWVLSHSIKKNVYSTTLIEEYLRQEIETDIKYEYHDGKIYSLADEKDPMWEVVFSRLDQQAKIIDVNINDGNA